MLSKVSELSPPIVEPTDHPFIQRIHAKTAKVGIIGLGYVGLPLAHAFISAGFRVMGFDVDQVKVDSLLAGESYIRHIPSQRIESWLKDDCFFPSADMKLLSEPDAILICVPTPLNESRDPDLSCIESTARAIAKHLRPGQLIVLESVGSRGSTACRRDSSSWQVRSIARCPNTSLTVWHWH